MSEDILRRQILARDRHKDWLERAGAGAQAIALERARQKEQEGYTAEHDDEHWDGELTDAALAYIETVRGMVRAAEAWPWSHATFKPGTPRQNLVKAGALICAEIDRLDRLERKR